jgi:AraC-like DNA-binding protein/mannose-6-phosphate isomerase-like protein (cupin superfamily)
MRSSKVLKPAQIARTSHLAIERQINAEGVHVWPFDPAFPLDIRFLTIDRHAVGMNRHDYFELVYGYSGEARFQVQQRELLIREGDLFIMGSTLFHRPVQRGRTRLDAVVLYYLPELIYRNGTIDEETVEYLMPFLAQSESFPHLVRRHTGLPSQVLHWIEAIHKELPATSSQAKLCVKTYLRMILMMLARHYKNVPANAEVYARKKRDIDRLRPLFEFMDQHYPERITLDTSASRIGMSNSYFKRFFKRVTGQTFVTYLDRFRIAKAQAWLASTDKSIADIAQETGFCSQSYFGVVFKKFAHTSPYQYRKRRHPTISLSRTLSAGGDMASPGPHVG